MEGAIQLSCFLTGEERQRDLGRAAGEGEQLGEVEADEVRKKRDHEEIADDLEVRRELDEPISEIREEEVSEDEEGEVDESVGAEEGESRVCASRALAKK